MPTVTFRCPSCQMPQRATIGDNPIVCRDCAKNIEGNPAQQIANRLETCFVCGEKELFVRKDFPQRLGVSIVVIGFAASCVTWNYQWIFATFGILFGTALIDVLLFAFMGDVLECYRCHAQYRDIPQLDSHGAFDLETHERHRQQQARLQESQQLARPNPADAEKPS